MQTADDGSLIYDYPRLKYGASHLDDPGNKVDDIISTIISATLLSLLLVIIFFILHCLFNRKRLGGTVINQAVRIGRGESDYPLRTFYLMLFLLTVTLVNLVALSADYHVFGTDKVGQDVLYQALKVSAPVSSSVH